MLADHVFAALVDEGIIDDRENVRRVVIDLQARHIAVMRVEYVCDEQLLDVVRGLDGIEVKAATTVAGRSVDCPIRDNAVLVKHDDGSITFDEAPAWIHVSIELLDGMGLGSYERSVFDAKYEVRDRCPYDLKRWHARLREHR